MGSTTSIIPYLFGFTLLAALAIGIWQWRAIKRSREARGEEGHMSHPPPDSTTPKNTPL